MNKYILDRNLCDYIERLNYELVTYRKIVQFIKNNNYGKQDALKCEVEAYL